MIVTSKRPGELRYRRAMGHNWLPMSEIAKLVGCGVHVVNTVIRRYEKEGLLERRVTDRLAKNKTNIIEWRWK